MKRQGFTLIELLIVIAIIGVLLGLVIAYLSGMMSRGRDVKTAVEIGAMEAALKKFHADHGFYPPSQFAIGRNFMQVQSTYPASARIWQKMYPSMTMIGPNPSGNPVTGSDWAPIDRKWIPLAPQSQSSPAVVLMGDQCLVFFLSGFGQQGLSPNPKNPADFNGLTGKKYYDFESSRLVVLHPAPAAPGFTNTFPSYMDPYGSPYAYFSEEGQSSQSWRTTDMSSAGTPQPYFQTLNGSRNYFKKFQIISAGGDKLFGTGGDYNPANPSATNAGVGFDDFTNIREKKMGIQ